ncbi:hypothetical protein QAD02_008808 [Eretmocerus hayati]|uniref:Uncharacterized protein n=1 Tax=Eretmocerus hayati TaxID=131215 RepID=A0ACC2N7U1_9HYME|nr:hypothetical protein QAD02_008808 [Eretmocerus hayati]
MTLKSLSLDEVKSFPKYSIKSSIPCQNEQPAARPGVATWSGVRLRDLVEDLVREFPNGILSQNNFYFTLLEFCKNRKTNTKYLWVPSADMERMENGGQLIFECLDNETTTSSKDTITFDQAVDPKFEALLAYEADGEEITPSHGYPIRLSDRERQEDEVFALQSILNNDELRVRKNGNKIECLFSISCELGEDKLQLKFGKFAVWGSASVKHLPLIHFCLQLPENYPSMSPPQYLLSISWLTPWAASLICQKLDELWHENCPSEILFTWVQFLKCEVLLFLDVTDCLDISYLYNLYSHPDDQFFSEILEWKDERVVYGGLNLNPFEKIMKHNASYTQQQFENQFHECGICFDTYVGKLCLKVDTCEHVFCKDCFAEFLQIKIKERNVMCIQCPAHDCRVILKSGQVQENCSSELFETYVKEVEESRLLRMRNLAYCPRKVCQTPVIIKDGENLASCPACEYNFCPFCSKVYHGVMPCKMDVDEKLKLMKEYKNGNSMTRKYLEKKYGKNQIRQIAEKLSTEDYLERNTRNCPDCGIMTTKISGCNYMNCSRCHINFCWLCNERLMENSYDHFKSDGKGPCTGRLFDQDDDPEFARDATDHFEFIQELRMIMKTNL